MANLLQTLISILYSITFLLTTTNTVLSQTISFAYDFSGEEPTGLTYQGDAYFPSDTGYLRLTEANPSYIGRVLYSNPVQFWETGGQIDFETTIKFIIPPNNMKLPADGLTFFIAPVGSTIPDGADGGNLGIFNSSGTSPSVFAVEFDNYWNYRWDPKYGHIGIDLGSRISRKTTAVGGAMIGQQVTARINYEESTKKIAVHVTAGTKTFHLSYEYDLSSFLPQQVQVGISAATGADYTVHEIVSWYFSATMVHTGGAKILQYA